jgi:hypothetical protein
MTDSEEKPMRIEVSRLIDATADEVFAVLRDPRGHVDIDASGMLMDATTEPSAAAPLIPRNAKRAARPLRERPSSCMSGGVLLSHAVPRAVPSALKGLTSGFGMGPGVSPTL